MFKNTITNTGQSPSFGIWAFAAFRPQLIFLDLHRCAILKDQKMDDVLNTFEEPISFHLYEMWLCSMCDDPAFDFVF